MDQQGLTGPRQNVKIALFALSGNQCAFPDCDEPVFVDGSIVGDICHIHAQSPGGPRFDEALAGAVHNIDNLILLCKKHHKIVDDHPEEYPAQQLKQMKVDHESRSGNTPTSVLRRLVEALAPEVPDKWWERPSAPVFRLHAASSRPDPGDWTFEIELEQIDGGDVGNLRYAYQFDDEPFGLRTPKLMRSRKWRLESLRFVPRGVPLVLRLRFWWDGGERETAHFWPKESRFQSAEVTVEHS